MSKEYIDRSATVDALNKLCDRVCQYSKAQRKVMCGTCPLGDAFTVIEDDLPAADVVEARSGVWTEKIVDDWTTQVNPFMRRRFYCSACGDWNTHGASKYCPHCGARMDGGVNDAAD